MQAQMDDNIKPSKIPYEFDSYGQRLFIGLIITCIIISGVFGNGLVIFSVFASHRLRNVTNVFVVNLAIADFLACLFSPASVTALVSPNGWPFQSDFFCGVAAMIVYVTIGVSLYNLASIAFNRWVLITKSVEVYQKIFGSKNVVISFIIFLWVFPSTLILLPVFMGFSRFGYNEQYHSCSDAKIAEDESSFDKIYEMILLIGIFLAPTVILFVCYWKVYKHISNHAKRLKLSKGDSDALSLTSSKTSTKPKGDTRNISVANSKTDLPRNNVTGTEAADNTAVQTRPIRKNTRIKTNLSRRQVEITKNLFYVLCAFLVCITPYLILLVCDDHGPLAAFAPYAACCLMVNNCINWIIYATKHPHFKVIFRRILTGNWGSIPEPVDCLRDRGERTGCCRCC